MLGVWLAAGAVENGSSCSRFLPESQLCTSGRTQVKRHWGDELGSLCATVSRSAADMNAGVHVALLALESGAADMPLALAFICWDACCWYTHTNSEASV